MTAPSATVAARSIGRLTVDQHVPTNDVGGMVQWGKADEGLLIQTRIRVGRRRKGLAGGETERGRDRQQVRQNPCAAPLSLIRHGTFHVRRERSLFKV